MLSSRFLTKIFATLAAAIVLTAAVVGVLQADRIAETVRADTSRALHDQVVLLTEIARPALNGVRTDLAEFQLEVEVLGQSIGSRLTVIADDGRVVADSQDSPSRMENHGSRPEVLAVRDGMSEKVVERRSRTVDQQLMYLARAVFHDGQRVGYVRAARGVSEMGDTISALRSTMMYGILVVALLACGIAFLVARQLTRPLRLMQRSVEAMAAGDFSRRVHVFSNDEVGALGAACNSLAEQLHHRIDVLGKERQRVVATLRSMIEGVVAVDGDQRVLFINDSARRMLSIEQVECVGLPFWELMRVQRIGAVLEETLQSQVDRKEEISLMSSGGDVVLELRSSPLRSEDDDTVRGAVLVFHDVSELRRLEQVRRDFVSNVSHELKTPLTAARGYLETLLDDPEIDEGTRVRFLRKIQEQTERLQALVMDQLTLAKIESKGVPLERIPHDMRDLVEGSIALLEPLAEQRSVTIRYARPEDALQVEGDRELLRQVAGNLLDNAVKYTPEDGAVEARLYHDGPSVVLEVEDSGIGLTTEDQQRIFERFYRADRARSREMGGTGLGLSIVRNVVVSYGGEISVASELGRGSKFTVRLPSAVSAAEGV